MMTVMRFLRLPQQLNKLVLIALILNAKVLGYEISYGTKKKILLWNPPKEKYCRPFDTIGIGNSIFKKFKCVYDNCYIYRSNDSLQNIRNPTDYDVIMFNGKLLSRMKPNELPKQRTPKQIYIFVQLESAAKYPILNAQYNYFFNWTMTYRLDSDIPWTYFQIKTMNNRTIGPQQHVDWIRPNKMMKMNKYFKSKFKNKSKTAWFTSNCHTIRTEKDEYINLLNERLAKLGMKKVDIVYGTCGKKVCRKSRWEEFHHTLEKKYFFYMAMENSYDKDFVTDKLLTAFQHNTVPIVYGGADYTRFAPPGSFISVNHLTPRKLAAIMTNLIKKPAKYHNFFKWRNHYHYSNNYDLSGVACDLCEKINEDDKPRSYRYFRRWWNRDHVNRYEMEENYTNHSHLTPLTTNTPTTLNIPEPDKISLIDKNQSRRKPVERSPKSILLFTPPDCQDCSLFDGFKSGNILFKDLGCDYTNCYINRGSNSNNPAVYDAILILGKTIHQMQSSNSSSYLPRRRRHDQIYVFVELGSPATFPVCKKYYDNYFNWTMTYRLDSDIPWTYYEVKTVDKEFVGPGKNVEWLKVQDMPPINGILKASLTSKMKLAIWADSNCYKREILEDMTVLSTTNDTSGRIRFLNDLNRELLSLDSTPIDVYDQCGTQSICPEDVSSSCDIIKEEYLFYLAFEDTIEADYVTDTLLRAFENYAVPIVFGGAKYERFAPPGSYLNAVELGPKLLAEQMVDIYNNRTKYFEFFKWRNIYTFSDNYKHTVGTACKLCSKLSRRETTVKTYGNFRFWWNKNWWNQCKGNRSSLLI